MADRSVRVRLSAEVSDYTSKMGQAASATDKVASAAEKAGKASQRSGQTASEGWSTLAGGAAKAGAAVAVVGGSMLKSYADFDQSMKNAQVATKATGSDLGRLRQAAMDAGAEFGKFSASDAAEGLTELGKAGLSTDESIGALRGTMALAASDGMSVARASEVTAVALAQFGMEGNKAEHAANLFAQGAGAAVGSAEELAQGLGNVGPIAKSFGMSMDDTVTTLAVFAKNGVRGAEGGTLLRSMIASLAKPSEQAAEGIKKMGLEAFDSQGKFVGMKSLMQQMQEGTKGWSDEQKQATLATIFGREALQGANIALNEGVKGYASMQGEMKAFGSATDDAARKNDTLKGAVANLGGAWETFSIKMMNGSDGPLKGAVDKLTSFIELASRHPQAAQQIGIAAASLAGLGLAGAGLVKTVQGVQAFAGALKAITGIGKTALAVSDVAGAAYGLDGKARGAAGGMSKLAATGTVVAAGLTVATVAGGAYQRHLDGLKATQDQVLTSALSLSKGSATGMQQLDQNITKLDTNAKSLGDAFNYLDGKGDFGERVGNSMGKAIPSVFGMKTATTSYREEIGKLDASLAAMKPEQAATAFNSITESLSKQGIGVKEAAGHFSAYRGQLQGMANALASTVPSFDAAKLSAADYAEWMGGKLPASVAAAAAASIRAKDANAGTSASMLAAAGAAGTLSASIESLPATQRVQIITDAAMAQTTVAGFVSSLQGLPPETIAKLKATAETESLDAAKAKLAEVKDKQVKVTVNKMEIDAFMASFEASPEITKRVRMVAESKGLDAAKKELDRLAASVKSVPKSVSTKASAPGAKNAAGDLKGQTAAAKAVPKSASTKASAPGAKGAAGDLRSQGGAAKAVPKSATTKASAPGATGATSQLRGQASAASAVPKAATTRASAPGAPGATGQLRGVANAANSIPPSRTSTITTIFRQIMQKIGFATGGYAQGYVRGPGTGTSDSIDAKLSNGEFVMRERAVRALGVARMDYINRTGKLPAFATGGLVGSPQRYATGGMVQTGNGITITYQPVIDRTTDMQRVGTAAAQLAAALERNRAAVQASTKASAPAKAAAARLTQAQQGKVALTARHRTEDAAWDAQIAKARAAGGGSTARQQLTALHRAQDAALAEQIAAARARAATGKASASAVAALQAKAQRVDLDYRARIAAAERAHQAKTVAALQQQRKAADLSYDRQIAEARQSQQASASQLAARKAAAQAEVRRLQQAKAALDKRQAQELAALAKAPKSATAVQKLQASKKASDLQQAKQMAAATAKVTAAERDRAAATARATAASEAAARSYETYRSAAEALAQAQQRVSETARAVSESVASSYGMAGSVSDWLATLREGGNDVYRFSLQLERLRAMGLSESLVQQVSAAGPQAGANIAQEIVTGGRDSVEQLNRAAAGLQWAADRMGRITAIGRAYGGPVIGAGTATSDSIPAWLSNGEHVWTAREVDALGGHDAMLRLRAAVLGGRAPRFAIGGQVGGFSQSVPRYAPQQRMAQQATQLTWAPQMQISGPDAHEVATRAMSMMRHESRSMAARFPGE
ncbi:MULTISPECIES: phage tail tape measure protein [unclassified Luteococcus]|uniref:phage tail tape measure protein n=1 Tax=unclassified Luteococcus TaxID=2639923 RepID=UPI00313F2C54